MHSWHDIRLARIWCGEQSPLDVHVSGETVSCDGICSNFMAQDDCGRSLIHSSCSIARCRVSCGVNMPHIQQTTGSRIYAQLITSACTVAFPPLPEQQRIAAYLDASCAAIDAAVAAKRRQLETLDALRQVDHSRAVTRGISDTVVARSPLAMRWMEAFHAAGISFA